VTLHERLFEDLAGDLEYHPKRGLLYLSLGVAALCVWIAVSADTRFTPIPLVFALGSLALLLKGVFFFRKTSEGLGITQLEVAQLADPSTRKSLPSIPILAAQVLQDFGAGVLLLGPVLHTFRSLNESRTLPSLSVFLMGAALFCVGWGVRRLKASE
jgi:hypothetical protein